MDSHLVWDNITIVSRVDIWAKSCGMERTLHDQRGEGVQEIQCYRSPEYKWNKNSVGYWKIVKVLKSYGNMDLDYLSDKGVSAKDSRVYKYYYWKISYVITIC